jgi:hypothetical protein
MSDQTKENSISRDDPPVKGAVDTEVKGMSTPSGEPVREVETSFFLLMVYAAVFGAGSGLLAALFLVVYDWGITFFVQPSHFGLNIVRFWSLVLLTVGRLLVGLAIKFTDEDGGRGSRNAKVDAVQRLHDLLQEGMSSDEVALSGEQTVLLWNCYQLGLTPKKETPQTACSDA